MFTTILLTLKKYLFYIIGILLIAGAFWFLINRNKALSIDNNRLAENQKNFDFKFDSVRTTNGKLQYSVNALTLKTSEFENINSNLTNELKTMNLKLKNIQSLTKSNFGYQVKPDVIKVEKVVTEIPDEQSFNFGWKDNYASVDGNLAFKGTIIGLPKISNLKLSITDSLTSAAEIQYKRVWLFWKKPKAIKIHLKSESPYFKLDKIQTYQLIK